MLFSVMLIEEWPSSGAPLHFHAVADTNYRGKRLAGSIIRAAKNKAVMVTVQTVQYVLFTICLLVLRVVKKTGLAFRKKQEGIRFQAMLEGNAFLVPEQQAPVQLLAGQYHIWHKDEPLLQFTRNGPYRYFSTDYSVQWLQQQGVSPEALPAGPQWMSKEMNQVVEQILHAPYKDDLLRFFYDSKIRELFFFLLSQPPQTFSGELTEKEIAAIYTADNLLRDSQPPLKVTSLPGKLRLTEFKLKKGFRQLFGMGISERRFQHRMNRAVQLLQQTDKPEKEIAFLTGYRGLPSFISAFKSILASRRDNGAKSKNDVRARSIFAYDLVKKVKSVSYGFSFNRMIQDFNKSISATFSLDNALKSRMNRGSFFVRTLFVRLLNCSNEAGSPKDVSDRFVFSILLIMNFSIAGWSLII